MYVGVSQGKQNNVAALEAPAFHRLIERSLRIVNTFSLAREASGKKKKKRKKITTKKTKNKTEVVKSTVLAPEVVKVGSLKRRELHLIAPQHGERIIGKCSKPVFFFFFPPSPPRVKGYKSRQTAPMNL